MTIAPELVPAPPKAAAHNLLDLPAWSWVAEARGAPRPTGAEAAETDLQVGAIFSTFPPGQEPDTWPSLPPARSFVWEDFWAGVAFGLLLLTFYFLYLTLRRSQA